MFVYQTNPQITIRFMVLREPPKDVFKLVLDTWVPWNGSTLTLIIIF